jgi:hypothetical protein
MAMGEAPGSAPKNVAGDPPVPLRRSELQILWHAATHEKKPLRGSTRALSIRTLAQLIVKGTPHGNYDFLAQAWQAANDKARELGWIV